MMLLTTPPPPPPSINVELVRTGTSPPPPTPTPSSSSTTSSLGGGSSGDLLLVEPQCRRSWNYHQTSIGEHLDQQRSPTLPDRRMRRDKLRRLMMRSDLVLKIDLSSLESLARDLKLSETSCWNDYIDVVLDIHNYRVSSAATTTTSSEIMVMMRSSSSPLSQEFPPISTRLLDDLALVSDRLVEFLDKEQLVRLRCFFMCIMECDLLSSTTTTTMSTKSLSSAEMVDDLERMYLRGLETSDKNYCSSVSLRFGKETTVYTCQYVHSPDFFIDLKMYDLNRLTSTSSSTTTTTNTMDGREAIVNVKLYSNQLYEHDLYSNVRKLAAQCISTIERRNIGNLN